MAKSTMVAYLCWLFGGLLGLHHFYLGRDRHAFTWFATLGGVFGLGWLREVTRLPAYVAEANQGQEYVEKRTIKMNLTKKPPYNSTRMAGQLIMGTLFGYLVSLAIPSAEEYPTVHRWCILLVPFAIGLGVHLVGNIGMERGRLLWPVVGAYIASLAFLFQPKSIAWAAVSSAFMFHWKSRDWVRQPKRKRHVCIRLATLGTAATVYLALWGSFLYFNASWTNPDGTRTSVRDAVDNFFHSKAWLDMKNSFEQLRVYVQHHGWQNVLYQLIEFMDVNGDTRAYQILEIRPESTMQEVTNKYRKLSREWHPDRHRDPEKKAVAQKRFIEIAQAYEKISAKRAKEGKTAKSTKASHSEL
ncbi:dnaJ homolog subfamily C member 22-like [Paramacrobiotus metropolitanus]|uniref:dnaJ homolog subfamily C member 22-like n=1 Tax=Paramacrobiotus metropolitanus TaxID=2943436 RepID=UPI002445E3FB|nr:dnaJ homolog subfamily C member 22-like [Paramacrobiotus metropolitanus]